MLRSDRPGWSSDTDEGEAGDQPNLAPSGYTGPALRRRLVKLANAEPSDARGVAAALEAVGSGKRASRGKRQSTGDEAGEKLLAALDDDELLDLRAEVIVQVRSDMIVVSELESKSSAAIDACRLDRADHVRSMIGVVTQQTQHAERSIAIVKSSEDTIRRLKESFHGMDGMIRGMQSMTSYNLVRQMHYFKANNEDVIKWFDILARIKDVDAFDEQITAGHYVEVYKDIVTVQKVRKSLYEDASMYRNQINLMQESFHAANEVIAAFVMELKRQLKIATVTAKDEFERREDGGDPDGEDEEEEGEGDGAADEHPHGEEGAEHHEGEEGDEGDGASKPAKKNTKQKSRYKLLLEVLAVITREQGHDGDVLRFTGDFPLADCTERESPFSKENVENLVRDGAHDHVIFTMLQNDEENVSLLCNAFDDVTQLYEQIEDIFGAMRGVVPLSQLLIAQIHESLVDQVEAHVQNAEDGGAVEQNDLIDLRRYFQNYIEQNVDYGGIVSQFTETEGLQSLVSRLLAAASDVLKDYLVRVSMNAAKARIIDQAIRRELPPEKELEPEHSDAALNVMATVVDAVKTVAASASLEVLHKLAVAVAAALSSFVKQELLLLNYSKFYSMVAEEHKKYEEIMHPKIPKGQKEAPPPPENVTEPINVDVVTPTWMLLVSASINGLTQFPKQLRPLERHFKTLAEADEVDLAAAGALPEGYEPGDAVVKWKSPVADVLDDMPLAGLEFVTRLVKAVIELLIRPEIAAMLATDDWTAGGPGSKLSFSDKNNAADRIGGMLEDAMTSYAEPLPRDERNKFRHILVWYFSVTYMEQVLKYLLPKAPRKWGHGKHVTRDVKIFTRQWTEIIEKDHDADHDSDRDTAFAIENTKQALQAFASVLSCTTGDEFLSLLTQQYIKVFPDTPNFFFELCLGNRPDMERNSKNRAEADWRSVWNNRQRNKKVLPTAYSIMDDTAIKAEPKKSGSSWGSSGSNSNEVLQLSDRVIWDIPLNKNGAKSNLLATDDLQAVNRGVKAPIRKKAAQAAHQTVSLADLLKK